MQTIKECLWCFCAGTVIGIVLVVIHFIASN